MDKTMTLEEFRSRISDMAKDDFFFGGGDIEVSNDPQITEEEFLRALIEEGKYGVDRLLRKKIGTALNEAYLHGAADAIDDSFPFTNSKGVSISWPICGMKVSLVHKITLDVLTVGETRAVPGEADVDVSGALMDVAYRFDENGYIWSPDGNKWE